MTNKKGCATGAFIGAVVGAVTSLLLAPKSGKELREDIKSKSNEYYEKTEGMREKGSEWVSIAKEKGSEVKDNVVSKSKTIKKKLTKKSKLQDDVETVLEEV